MMADRDRLVQAGRDGEPLESGDAFNLQQRALVSRRRLSEVALRAQSSESVLAEHRRAG